MIVELETPKSDAVDGDSIERIELFSIDGKAYTIPDQARPSLALRYLYICRTRSVGIAESWLAEQLLGEEGYLALINFESLSNDDYNKVIEAARAVALGEIRPKELKKANGSGRPSRTAPARKQSPRRKNTTGL